MKLLIALLIIVVVMATNVDAESRAIPMSRSMAEQFAPNVEGLSGPNADANAGPGFGGEGGGEEGGRRRCYFCGYYNCWG